MNKQLEPPLRKAIAFLEEHGYRYAVIGGIALSQWQAVRVTRDVDIKVLVPDTDFASVRTAIRAAFPDPARTDQRPNPYIVAVMIEGVIVDFLLATRGYEEQIIQRAVQHDLGGWWVWICSPEDLIIQKVYSRRLKDWPDVEALLIKQRDHLDQKYIEYWVDQFAQALYEPDILTQYRRLVARVNALPRKS